MSGKQHSTIGFLVACVLGAGISLNALDVVSVKILLPMTLGAIVGSLIVDIDSKRSKASQQFTKVVMYLIWSYVLVDLLSKVTTDNSVLEMISHSLGAGGSYLVGQVMEFFTGSIGMVLFCVLVTLGKFSPHRQFTHKWFGTLLFLFVGYIAFSDLFFIGYTIGYVLHIVCDKTTKAGLDFLDFKLPMQNKKNEFSMHF